MSRLKSLRDSKVRSTKVAVAVFLFKMKTDLSNATCATIFFFKTPSDVAHYCEEVICALNRDIIPYWIGVESVSRSYLENRQSDISRRLNPNSEVILVCDGTYAYHEKSSNNLYQRKSYSVHKGKNLCKPFTVCTTDGFIVDFFGAYTAHLNDAKIMMDVLKDEGFINLLKPGDCFVVDRGFRDSVSAIESLGYMVKMPAFKKK